MAQKDYYEILGIRPTASQQEIELAYKARRTQYHPDKYATSDEATVQWATAQIQEVNRAYEVLSDEQRRQEYDEAYSPSDEEASQQTEGNASGQNSARLVEGIIPLSMTHDDLEKQIYRYMASGNYTPDDMLEAASITLKESFYVPAYVFQVEYSATWTASFGYDRTEAHKAYRTVTGPRGGKRREAYTEYRTVTDWRLASGVDEDVFFVSTYAGNRLNNLALEPAGLVPGIVSEGGVEAFNPSHAKGIEVEPSSVSPADAFQALQPKINTTIDNSVKKHSQGDHQKDWRWNATMTHEMVTVVVPLCHATFAYGGKNYDFWVSGHNGKEIRATSLPVDQGRKNLIYAGFAPLAAGLAGVGLVTSMGGFMWVTLTTSALAAAYGIMRRKSIIGYSKKHREALLDQLNVASARNGLSAEERAQLAKAFKHPEKPVLAKSGNDKVVLPILAIASLLGAMIPVGMGKLPHLLDQRAPMAQEANSATQNPGSGGNPLGTGQTQQTRVAQNTTPSRAQERGLMRLVGGKPASALDAPELKERFAALLGANQSDFRENLTISDPITSDGVWLAGAGGRPHAAVTEQAIFAIDQWRGEVCAAMFTGGQKVTLFGRNDIRVMPSPIVNWYDKIVKEFGPIPGTPGESIPASGAQTAQNSPPFANAASFDCKKAATFAEREICSDSLLSKLDGALSNNYKYMAASDIGDGARNDLKVTQKSWIAARDKCTNKQCLVEAYRERIDSVCEYPVISGIHPTCATSDDIK
ncbi:MAG: DnaJ domain-containing protein [Pseudomonadota bacterium]